MDQFDRDIRRAIEQLGKIEGAVTNNLMKAAEAGADVVKIAAKRNVSRRTGRLGSNIKTRSIKQYEKSAEYEVFVAKNGFYGYFLEYGTSKMSARPFFRPAIDSTRGEVDRVMAHVITSGTKRGLAMRYY